MSLAPPWSLLWMGAAPAPSAGVLPGLGTLLGWYDATLGTFQDAARTTPASADADPVGGWTDQSGVGNHASQSTSTKRPALKLAIKNGRSILRGDAVDDGLVTTAYGSGTTFTLLAAYKRTTTFNDILVGDDAGTNYQLYIDATNLNMRVTAGVVSAAHGVASDIWSIFGVRRNGTTVRFYKNGVQVGTDQTLAANTAVAVGSILSRVGGTFPSKGDLGEIAYYGNSLSDANVTAAFNDINGRWAIY